MGECMIDSLCVESAHRKNGGGALTEWGVFKLFVIRVVERRASRSQRWVGGSVNEAGCKERIVCEACARTLLGRIE